MEKLIVKQFQKSKTSIKIAKKGKVLKTITETNLKVNIVQS